MPPISKLQRWLDLIAYLVGRRIPVAVDELMEKIPAYAAKWQTESESDREAVRRMFERDKDELRSFGIPIHTVEYSINFGLEQMQGYRIARGDFYLPYLRVIEAGLAAEPNVGFRGRSTQEREEAGVRGQQRDDPRGHMPTEGVAHTASITEVELTQEEVQTALEALRRAANVPAFPFSSEAASAFRKLAFDLDPATFATESPAYFVEQPRSESLRESLRLLSDALLARKRVHFDYHGMTRDEKTERAVAPYGLLYQSHWYLVGHDALRDGVRVFRVMRMSNVRPNTRQPGTPDFEVPPEFRLDAYADRSVWELREPDDSPVRVDVLFGFPQSLWAERNEYGTLVERRPDGAQLRSFDVSQIDAFLRWILSLEGEATIASPPTLRQALAEFAHAIAARHGLREAGTETHHDADA